MMQWKCTKCCAMVGENEMKRHKCNTNRDLMPPLLRSGPDGGTILTRQISGAISLASLRAKQYAGDKARAAKRKADQAAEEKT